MLSIASLSLANTAEMTTSTISSANVLPKFDSFKATWNTDVSLGDHSTSVATKFDFKDGEGNLDVTLTGDVVDGVSYKVSDALGDKSIKLTAAAQGMTVTLDQGDGLEVSTSRDIDLGDQTLNVKPTWLVKANTARVKLMSKLGGDSINAQIDYDIDGGEASLKEVSLDHHIEDGRDVSATFSPGSSNLKVDYVDKKVDSGATWTATATVPLEDRNNIVDSASLKLKRAWSW
jgi:hypothetical protein